jgi:hypothetical protein
MTGKNLGVSIRDRLLDKARAEKLDFNLLLTRYAIERTSAITIVGWQGPAGKHQ